MPDQESTTPSAARAARYRVPAAARALTLLEFLADTRSPLGVSEVARRVGIPKSSCFALLGTLEAAGYVRRNQRDEWSITLKVHHIGMQAARSVDLVLLAQPALERLRDETGMTVHLGIPEHESVVYALKVESPGMVRFDTYPGKPASLHLTALGLVISAFAPERELAPSLDGYRFDGGTEGAISSRAQFDARLRAIREQGVVFEDGEENTGVGCVAAPVFGQRGRVVGAVGITALTAQLQAFGIERSQDAVRTVADEVSRLLDARGTGAA
jgi:DNA-binding IclR family transcriptional regulator